MASEVGSSHLVLGPLDLFFVLNAWSVQVNSLNSTFYIYIPLFSYHGLGAPRDDLESLGPSPPKLDFDTLVSDPPTGKHYNKVISSDKMKNELGNLRKVVLGVEGPEVSLSDSLVKTVTSSYKLCLVGQFYYSDPQLRW
jgi:hypothetical protein